VKGEKSGGKKKGIPGGRLGWHVNGAVCQKTKKRKGDGKKKQSIGANAKKNGRKGN